MPNEFCYNRKDRFPLRAKELKEIQTLHKETKVLSYNKNPDILTLCVYKTFIDKFGEHDQEVHISSLIEQMRRLTPKIPRYLDPQVLKEMEKYHLVTKINQQKYIIKGKDAQNKLKKLKDFWLW